MTDLMDPAGQIKFILARGEFNLSLITNRLDFLAFKISLLANIQSLTLFSSISNLHSK